MVAIKEVKIITQSGSEGFMSVCLEMKLQRGPKARLRPRSPGPHCQYSIQGRGAGLEPGTSGLRGQAAGSQRHDLIILKEFLGCRKERGTTLYITVTSRVCWRPVYVAAIKKGRRPHVTEAFRDTLRKMSCRNETKINTSAFIYTTGGFLSEVKLMKPQLPLLLSSS